MTTRSGLSIKKYPVKSPRGSPAGVSQRVNQQVSTASHLLIQAPPELPAKQPVRPTCGVSIVTRFELMLEGTELNVDDLNVTNSPERFLATEQQLRDSVTCGSIMTILPSSPAKPASPPVNAIPDKLVKEIIKPSHSSLPSPILPAKRKAASPVRHTDHSFLSLLDTQGEIDLKSKDLLAKVTQFCCSNTDNKGFIPTNQSLYRCIICRKVYGALVPFAEHVNTHLKLKNECRVCGRVFTRNWLLKNHMRIHTGEKPFSCDQCGKAFADKSNLRSHMLIHTVTTKSHQCTKCLKSFAQRRYLHKHMLEVCK